MTTLPAVASPKFSPMLLLCKECMTEVAVETLAVSGEGYIRLQGSCDRNHAVEVEDHFAAFVARTAARHALGKGGAVVI